MTAWEYHRIVPNDHKAIERLNVLGALGWELVTSSDHWLYLKRPKSPTATHLTLTLEGATMATTFTVDTTTGNAKLQFTDDHGDPVAGPVDSVTSTPVTPVVTSDAASVLTAATAVADATIPGLWTAALTPVAEGTANVGVAPLVNSDGSAVLETVGPNAGQPFEVPVPEAVTVTAGTVAALTLTVGS